MPKVRSSPRNKTPSSTKTTPPLSSPRTPAEIMPPKHKTPPISKRKRNTPHSNKKEEGDKIPLPDMSTDDIPEQDTKTYMTEDYEQQPVGQQLLEQLDKVKNKKIKTPNTLKTASNKKTTPPLKTCSNCGTEAKTTRTKKCHTCGEFLSVLLAKRYSVEPCWFCHEVPKLSRSGRPDTCPNCHRRLLFSGTDDVSHLSNSSQELLCKEEVEERGGEEKEEEKGDHHEEKEEEEEREEETNLTTASTVDTPLSVGYGITATSLYDNNSDDSTNKESMNRFYKRIIRNSINKKSFNKSSITTKDLETPSTSGGSPSLSLPLESTNTATTGVIETVSSPLLEYAQKISARVMIPPEIPQVTPRKNIKQNKKIAGLVANSKATPTKNKGGMKGKKDTPTKQDDPLELTPVSSLLPDFINPTPISRHLTPPTSLSSYTPDSLVVSVTTKPHDPTINSIRTLYRSHPLPPPPLIKPDYYNSSTHSLPTLPPPLFTNHGAPPPLVSWSEPPWYNKTTPTLTPPIIPTHQPVIVDPKQNITNESVSFETKLIPKKSSEVTMATDEHVSMETESSTAFDVSEPVSMTTDKATMTTGKKIIEEKERGKEEREGGKEEREGGKEERGNEGVKYKHKRKQVLEVLQDYGDDDTLKLVKKKKKKKKREKEKEKSENSPSKHHHHHHHEKKAKKKKKSKKREREETEEEEDSFIEQPSTENSHHERSNTVYSVKIADATFHQLRWGKYRMTLLIPNGKKKNLKSVSEREATPIPTHTQQTVVTPSSSKEVEGDEGGTPKTRSLRSRRKRIRHGEEEEDGGGEEDEEEEEGCSPPIKSKRNKKNKRIKCEEKDESSEQLENERNDEIDEDDDHLCLSPSFSVFELRGKIFDGYPPRTVHAFTYKLKAKTKRPPLHWVHILRHMGGLPDSVHTCRLLDVNTVQQMCDFHKVEIPFSLSLLLNNNLSSTRKVYDLSHEDVLSFISNSDVLQYNLPKCYFNDILKKKSSKESKSHHKVSQQQQEEVTPLLSLEEETTEGTLTEETLTTTQDEGEEEEEEEEEEEREESLSHTSSSITTSKQNKSVASAGTGRKKPCPHCGVSVLCKAKKCRNCGKLFGVFSFGRRTCVICGHINLARMTACFRCSHPLDKAPTARPKDIDDPKDASEIGKVSSVAKFNFKFGVKKRLRTHSSPPPLSSSSSSFNKIRRTHEEQDNELFIDTGGGEGGGASPILERKRKGKMEQHLGYRYGKIPWNDADLALIITNKGIYKFCLQEMCNKVLRYHNKSDVFELVKNLHLSLEQGNSNLLRKLQALGLHPNRSPICKLISTDDLFALMDALEEPVPDEVHQHLETISSHSTPQSPSSPNLTPVFPSSVSLVGVPEGGAKETDDNEFESTLHEIRCSDGQSLSMLRTWKGVHYLCLLEVWRRYFPEVNRSHLSTTIKRLQLDTSIPTSQQTNLLRAANVISMRGAPGRLIKLSDVQILLDDFGIPIHVGGNTKEYAVNKLVPTYYRHSKYGGTEMSQMRELSNCMKHLINIIDDKELIAILKRNETAFELESNNIEIEINALSVELDLLQHALCEGRDLCQTLSDEISFLTVTNHTKMTEIVRLKRLSLQSLNEVDLMIENYSQLMEH